MADDTKIRGWQDSTRINISEPYEITYWTNKWGVTPEQLKAAAAKVGPSATDIARELGK
jgi:hypothetical protein